MAGSGNADFLYSVGVDLTKANADLQEWSGTTVPTMMRELVKPIQIQVGYAAAKTNIQNFVNYAKEALKAVPPINVSFNFSGASRSLNAFISNFKRNAAAIKELEQSMVGLNQAGVALGDSFQRFSGGMGNLRENVRGAAQSTAIFTEESGRAAVATERQTAAIDYLGKIAIADTAKILAWGAAFTVVQGAMRGFNDAIRQAGEVQMEQVLQRLYNSTIDVGQAFKNAEMIAKVWGGDIVDIQQAIGLWTKQTGDLAAATMLANKGEEMARASGIATLDVYKDSVAIGEQMGLTYGQLPKVYDQVAEAALLVGGRLRSATEEGKNQNEVMKDLFQGLAQASATLAANGFADLNDKLRGTASIVAIIGAQMQATGESGSQAAAKLSTLFGALDQGGKKRGTWESILGAGAFKDADSLLDAIKKKITDIEQQNAQGNLGVRPQSVETLATFEKNLDKINQLYHQIYSQSGGKLDFVALAEMNTYQAQVDRLKTSVQALEIAWGNQLLPSLQSGVQWMASSAIPTMEAWAPHIQQAGSAVLQLGAAWLLLQGYLKGSNFFAGITAQIQQNRMAQLELADAEAVARRAGFDSAAQMNALKVALEQEKIAAQEDAQAVRLLAAAYAQFGADAGLSEAQLARLTTEQRAAGEQANVTRGLIAEEGAVVKGLQTELFATGEQMQLFTDAEMRAVTTTDALVSSEGRLAGLGSAVAGAMGTAASGIGLVAGAAGRAIGPLAAMYALMQLGSDFVSSQNKESNLIAGIQARGMAQQPGGVGGPWWQGILGPLGAGVSLSQNWTGSNAGIQGIMAWMTGKGGQTGSLTGGPLVPADLNANLLRNPQYKQQYADLLGQYYSEYTKGQDTRGTVDAIAQLVDSYKKNSQGANAVTDSFNRINKQLQRQEEADRKYQESLNKSMGSGDSPRAFYQAPPAKGGSSNPFSAALTQATDAYTGLVKQKESLAAADDTEIKTNELLIQLYGRQPQYLAAIDKAFKDKEAQYTAIDAAANKYITQLKAEIQTDQSVINSTADTATKHKQAVANMAAAEKALAEAEGLRVDALAKVKEAEVERIDVMEKDRVATDLQKLGITDINTQLRQMTDNLGLLKGSLVGQIDLGQQYVTQLNAWDAGLKKIMATLPPTSKLYQQLQSDLASVDGTLKSVSGTVTTDVQDLTKLGDTITKLGTTLTEGNFKDLADALGVNKQTVSYVDAMLKGLQDIRDTQTQINTYNQQLADLQKSQLTPVQQAYVTSLQNAVMYDQQELDLKRQLLPIEQQILAIRSSTVYQAFNSQLDKLGSGAINNLIPQVLGKSGGFLQQFVRGMMQQIGDDWWKNFSQKISDTLFGGSSAEAKMQQTFNTLYANLTREFSSFDGTVTGPLTTAGNTNFQAANIMLQASQNNLRAAQGGTGTTTNGIPLPTGTGTSYSGFEQEFGISNPMDWGSSIESNIQTAQNTSDMLSVLQDLQNSNASFDMSINASGGGSSSISGGGPTGLLSLLGLLGGGGGMGGLGGLLGGGAGGAAGAAFGGLGSLGGMLSLAGMAGGLFGGLFGGSTGSAGQAGHQSFGMMGGLLGGLGMLGGMWGALGGGLMPLLAGMGPAGWGLILGATLLGAFGGSLFGDHFPIKNEPDIGEPVIGGVSYGQFVADMNGAPGSFNGKTIDPFSQFAGANREAVQLETDVQKVLSNPTKYGPQLVQMAKQLQALNPHNEPEGFSILSEYNDVFTLHSGAQINVEQYMGMAQKFMAAFAKTPQQQLAPIISINGAGTPPGWNPNFYNTPGLSNSEFYQTQQGYVGNWGGGAGSNTYGGGGSGSPPVYSNYSTPGFGSGYTPTQAALQNAFRSRYGLSSPLIGGGNTTVQLLLNGKVLAQVVNAYNAQYLLNSGKSVDQIPVIP